MQSADDGELAAHIAGELGERRPAMRFEVDWTGDGVYHDLTDCVDTLDAERSLTGDLPAEAGLIDGYASSTCTIALSGGLDVDGEVWPVTAALSPFVPGSLRDGRQLVQATARASLGMVLDDGPVLMRQWSGPIRDLDSSVGDGTVTLSGVDPSDRLRAPITLPTYSEFITHVHERGRGVPGAGWAFTVNTQWLVDHILRQNGIYASPPPRAEAIISATGHGGLVAERGFNGAPISREFNATAPRSKWTDDGDHPWGMLAPGEGTPASYQEFYGITDGETNPVEFRAGYGVGISCWLHVGNYMSGSSERRIFSIRPTTTEYPQLFVNGYDDGGIRVGLADENQYVTATPKLATGSGAWRFLGVHYRWTNNSTLEVRVRLDGQTRTYTLANALVTVTPGPFYDGYRPILLVDAQLYRAWTNLQLWPAYDPPPAGPWQGETHVADADIDRGLNELVYLPDVVNADSWELLKEIVTAEFGVHRFDETGRYSFRRRTDTRRAAVDIDLNVTTNLADVSYSTSTDSVRNIIGIHTKSKYHTGEIEAVVKAQDAYQFTVPGGRRYVYEVDWPYGTAGWQGGILPYHYQPNAEVFPGWAAPWSDDVAHGWTYSTRGASGRWTIMDNVQSVVVSYVQTDARRALIIVDNRSGSKEIRLATAESADGTQTGQPALHIGGWPLVDVPDHVEEYRAPAARIAAHLGERVLPIDATDWRQDPAALRPLAAQLLDALADEVPVLEDLPIVGDPRVQVGDVARCRFPHGATPVVGTVVKTAHSADDSGLTTAVSVRPLPEALIPDDPDPGPGPDPGNSVAPPGWTFYIDVSRYQGDGNPPNPIDFTRVADAGYAGCVVKIGQGASAEYGYGETIDPWWSRFRDESLAVWPDATAGYWYVGATETPQSQANRCATVIGNPDIPIMLDWEEGSGTWNNVLAVRDAFTAAGLNVTMLYTRASFATASANGPATDIDGTGLALVNSRYWLDSGQYPEQDPRAVFDDIQATRPGFGFDPFAGGTVDALQFTDAGVVYRNANGQAMAIDVNAYPGTAAELADMLNGRL